MKISVAAIQMPCAVLDVRANLERADGWLRQARQSGADLVVLPEMFNTGYGLCPDYTPYAEGSEGPTLRYLRDRATRWRIDVAAGFVERDGRHLYDALAFVSADGDVRVYRKRNLVFWERFRFYPGRDPLVVKSRWGRIGFAICADMIYRRVWHEYRGKIDLAVVSAAWPDFADRETGRSRRRSRGRSPRTWESPSSSRTSAARRGPPSRSSGPRSPTVSPGGAASATAGMAPHSRRAAARSCS